MAVLPQPNGMLKEEKEMTITRIDAEARWSDVVVLCLGEMMTWSGENASRSSIALPQIQEELAKELKKAIKSAAAEKYIPEEENKSISDARIADVKP